MLRLSRLALLAIISVVVSGQGYQGPATAAPAGPAPAGPAPAGPAPAGPAPAGPAPAGPAPAGPAPAGPAPAGPGASAPGSGLPPRIATAAYSCTKIPFKKECTTGFPSQLVLRWYLKDGKCCSYPYGHCKGEDDTLTNPGIRTKADCESICVKGDKSQPGAGPAAGGGGGGAAPGAVGPAPSGGGGGAGGAAPTGGAPAPGGAGGATAPGSGLPPRVATAQYSCTKIPFKGTCTTGFPSQLVLRWYLKDGKCCSYPYGHCKGEDDTLTNPGIRTKADCESICVKGDKSQPGAGPAAGGGGGAAAPGGGGPAPSGGGGGGGGAPTGGAPPPGGAAGPGASAPGSGLPPRIATAAYSCTKIPFKKECTTGFPSQLVLRWYLKDGKCCSYPYGHCKGEDDTLTNPGIRTKADCESICIKGDKSQPGGSPGGSPGTGTAPTGGNLPGGVPNQPGAGTPGAGVPAAGGPSPGGQPTGSGLPPRVATAQYSCTKIPFKGTCTTGFPSQLVLRWYLKDGKCCSYPYGHCKGEDDTLTNPGIRTKADCESICVKGDKSQPGDKPGTNVPGTNVPGTNVPGTNVPGTNQPGYPGGR